MIVADASPIIALARIGRLAICRELFDIVLIPAAVETEILQHRRGFEGPRPSWVSVGSVTDTAKVADLQRRLDRGEAEALVLAFEHKTPILLDEAQGRRMAATLGVSVVGTLGLLLTAKRAGLIPRLGDELDKLRGEGFYMSDRLVSALRQAANED